jgi:hypothetical protein
MNKTVFSALIVIFYFSCAPIPSTISSVDYNLDQIELLSILHQKYFVYTHRALGLPIENMDAEITLFEKTNWFMVEYLNKYNISLTSIPDSILTRKENVLIDDNFNKLVSIIGQKRRTNSNYIENKFGIPLSRFGKFGNSPYLVLLRLSGWNSTKTSKTLDFISGTSSIQNNILLHFAIVEAESSKLLWYCQKSGALDPENPEHINAVVKSLIFNLIYNIDVSPESFAFDYKTINPVSVYTHDKRKINGEITSFDVFDFTLVDDNNTSHNMSLKDVSSIQSRYQNKIIFPKHTQMKLRKFNL